MDKKRAGVIAVIALILGFGGNMAITPEEIDETYYCALTEQVGIFDRMSTSMKTGYYMEEDVEKKVACRTGNTYDTWIPLREYAELNNVPIEDIINPEKECEYGATTIVKGVQGEYECEYIAGGLEKYSKCYKNGVFSVYAGELICG